MGHPRTTRMRRSIDSRYIDLLKELLQGGMRIYSYRDMEGDPCGAIRLHLQGMGPHDAQDAQGGDITPDEWSCIDGDDPAE